MYFILYARAEYDSDTAGDTGRPPCMGFDFRAIRYLLRLNLSIKKHDLVKKRHCLLVQRIAFDLAHLDKRRLRRCIVICNQVGTGQIQLLRPILHDLGKRRDQLCQLDRLADFILCHAEKLSYNFSRVVPLAIVAKGFNCRISLSAAVSGIQQRFIRLAALNDRQILPPQKIRCNRNADGTLVVDVHNCCRNIRPSCQLCRCCAVMPGQNLKFIRSCDGAKQNPLIQAVLF